MNLTGQYNLDWDSKPAPGKKNRPEFHFFTWVFLRIAMKLSALIIFSGSLASAGVDVFVVGSTIFGGGNYADNIRRLQAHMSNN